MTIDVNDIKCLLRNKEMSDRMELQRTKEDIELTKSKLHALEGYKQKLSFHIDKSTKLLEIIEMDEKTDKPFKEIHKNLFEQDDED